MHTVKIDRILQALIGILLVVLILVISDAVREKVVGVGDTAPDFSIKTDGGITMTRSNFGGRLLVLNFWATWCPPCVKEIPALNEFYRQLKDSGVVVLGVSVDRNERVYRNFLGKVEVSYLTARDPEAKIPSSYGTYKYPETYVIDARGQVVQKIIGDAAWTDAKMLSYIRSLL